MSRSKWKGPNYVFLKKKSDNLFFNKAITIIPSFIGKIFKVYTGHLTFSVKMINVMLAFKIGVFIITRKKHFYKK